MKNLTHRLFVCFAMFFGHSVGAELVVDKLYKTKLEVAENTDVFVSKVEIPPNSSLQKHWHHGEEFVYVLDGSVTLWQKDKTDTVFNKGDVVHIPLKQIHTAITGDKGASVVVFRVHEEGKPERVKVK